MLPLRVNRFTQDHPRSWANSVLCKKSWQHHKAPSPERVNILSRKELDDIDLSKGVRIYLEGCRFNLRAKIWHEIILEAAIPGENFSQPCLLQQNRFAFQLALKHAGWLGLKLAEIYSKGKMRGAKAPPFTYYTFVGCGQTELLVAKAIYKSCYPEMTARQLKAHSTKKKNYISKDVRDSVQL